MREIEVKYRVDDLEALQAVLKAQGIELSDPVFQDDQAYAPASWQFGDSKLGVSFLRLRTVSGRHYFTLKKPADNAQACLEHETEVADRDAMHHAAIHMGYRPTVRITKTRRTVAIGDWSLCVDDLDGVGGFLEVERWHPTTPTPRQYKPSSPPSSTHSASPPPAPPKRTTRSCTPPKNPPASRRAA